MPTLLGGFVGIGASLAVEQLIGAYLPVRARATLSLFVFVGAFYATRRYLLRLRAGR